MADIQLEIGKRRSFATAVDWPGWSRSGRDEAAALQALFEYGPRYAKAIEAAQLGFAAPDSPEALVISERAQGNASTDFGSPAIAPARDAVAVGGGELQRFLALLDACWKSFDAAVQDARGVELRKGPRGGGRDLAAMVRHVLEADAAYLGRIGWRFKVAEDVDPAAELSRIRAAIRAALTACVHGELPQRGPRGAAYWSPRYFVRRVAWHVLDHAWEIEDRAT